MLIVNIHEAKTRQSTAGSPKASTHPLKDATALLGELSI
jgi:hypothetical protein